MNEPKPEVNEVLTYLENADRVLADKFPATREAGIARMKIEEAVMWLAATATYETP